MKTQITYKIWLDPVKEGEAVALYEKDKGWLKTVDCTKIVGFEYSTPEAEIKPNYYASDKVDA